MSIFNIRYLKSDIRYPVLWVRSSTGPPAEAIPIYRDCGQVEQLKLMIKFYYTYVLLSLKDGKFYIGWTNDLKSRIKEHALGLVKATKFRRPLKLVYYEACLSKEKAITREKALKTGFGRKYILRRI